MLVLGDYKRSKYFLYDSDYEQDFVESVFYMLIYFYFTGI